MSGATIEVQVIACLRDNYAYLIVDQKKQIAWLVDAPEANAILTHLARASLRLEGILATHHHQDHVGAIETIRESLGDQVEFVLAFEGERDRIPQATHYVPANTASFSATNFQLAGRPLEILHVPGHTRGHVAFRLADEVFTGDCLFAAGCGRLFEGSAEQMHRSLATLCSLPEHTRLWFGHEYTRANLEFAATAEPDNPQIRQRLRSLPSRTVPTTVGEEKRSNPFVRSADAAQLAQRRQAKNEFRG
jgi:hydroxyacylglutathione hydrolase